MNSALIDQIEIAIGNPLGTPLANFLNALSLIKEELGEGSWVGIYLYEEKSKALLLGPFQGKEACVLIKPKKGLVGACFEEDREIYAPNVNKLDNYISCDPMTLSEFVCPLHKPSGEVMAIFDIDSPKIDGLRDFLPILRECSKVLKSAPYLENFSF